MTCILHRGRESTPLETVAGICKEHLDNFPQWDKRFWTCVSVMDKQEWKGFYELRGHLVPWYHTVSTSKVNSEESWNWKRPEDVTVFFCVHLATRLCLTFNCSSQIFSLSKMESGRMTKSCMSSVGQRQPLELRVLLSHHSY